MSETPSTKRKSVKRTRSNYLPRRRIRRRVSSSEPRTIRVILRSNITNRINFNAINEMVNRNPDDQAEGITKKKRRKRKKKTNRRKGKKKRRKGKKKTNRRKGKKK